MFTKKENVSKNITETNEAKTNILTKLFAFKYFYVRCRLQRNLNFISLTKKVLKQIT
jgi:3-methyladenine DNA glycosylase AlkC